MPSFLHAAITVIFTPFVKKGRRDVAAADAF
jgi:hypothetical protein